MRRHLHAVVLAGGAGQRFWPRSRRSHPKPLLAALGDQTLLGATLGRARRFADPDRTWLICGAEHARPMRAEAGLATKRVIVEPRSCNTAMAVSVAAQRIMAEDPDAVLVVLPADHVIPDAAAFAKAVARAATAAAGQDVLVTLGVRPTRPDTGYGYIRAGKEVGDDHPGLHRVVRFVEKPDLARARRFLRGGNHLWNAGIFVWKARTLLEEVQEHAPGLHRALAPLRQCVRGRGAPAALRAAYRKAPSLPVDVAVLEKSRRVWTLPVDFHWSDVGNWASLAQELGVQDGDSHVIAGDVVEDGSAGNLVWGDGRLVVLLGVDGLAVIDTPDALLVTRLDHSHEIRRVVERLGRDRGRRALT